MNRKAIEDSMKKLSHFGLIEYNNQNKEGFDTANYARITNTGAYYLRELASSFAYIDLVFEDTPICDDKTLQILKKKLNVEYIANKRERLEARFERTETFLNYLKEMEDDEFKKNPQLTLCDLTKSTFMDTLIEECYNQISYIREKVY